MEAIAYLVGSIVVVIIGIYFLLSYQKRQKIQRFLAKKSRITVIMNKPHIPRARVGSRSEIVREAEAWFIALKQKYPESPLPYKTIGDFYFSRGLPEDALLKYYLMVEHLNDDVPFDKLAPIIEFLQSKEKTELIQKIMQHFQSVS